MPKETPQFDEKMLAAMFQHIVGKLDPDRLTKQEIEEFLAKMIEHVKGVGTKNEATLEVMINAVNGAISNLAQKHDLSASDIRKEVMSQLEEQMNKMRFDHEAMIAEMRAMMDDKESMEEEHDQEMMDKMMEMIPEIPELKPETPESIRAKAIASKLNINELGGIDELKDQFRAMIPQRSIGALSGSVVHKFIDDETPSGTKDGNNQTFYLSKAPVNGSLKLYRGGARQRVNEDYTILGKTITITVAPQSSEILLADFRYF